MFFFPNILAHQRPGKQKLPAIKCIMQVSKRAEVSRVSGHQQSAAAKITYNSFGAAKQVKLLF